MDDTVARGHNSEVAEGSLTQFKEGESLLVSVEFDLLVAVFGVGATSDINLDGVVNDKVCLAKRVDLVGITTKLRHGSPHCRKVNHGGHSSKILEEHASRLEGNLN